MCINRVPYNGRNFEYISGEDPHLGYVMAGSAVTGIQSTGVIANAKHWVLNSQVPRGGYKNCSFIASLEHRVIIPVLPSVCSSFQPILQSAMKYNSFCTTRKQIAQLRVPRWTRERSMKYIYLRSRGPSRRVSGQSCVPTTKLAPCGAARIRAHWRVTSRKDSDSRGG
jgi:hypothetical protein